jgi:acyl-CoA thioesterase
MDKELIEKLKQRYILMIKEVNYDHFIDPNILVIEEGKALVEWKPKPLHLNRFGSVHGGAISGLIDTVAAITALTKMKRIVTIDMHVSYIKAATIATTVKAVGRVIHGGRSLVRTEVELFDAENNILARGQVDFFVLGDLTL